MMRRFLAEFIGTFCIVFVPVSVSATAMLSGLDHGLFVAAWVSGLPVLAMICALGPISAAHFNPAVTLGFAVAKRFPWKFVLPYWMFQFSGAIAAGALSSWLFLPGGGAHIPADPSHLLRNLGTEISITFFLMLVIMAVATDRRVPGIVAAVGIGMTVVIGVMIGGPITGGSMNPARSVGADVFAGSGAMPTLWIYFAGPMLGSIFGALVYERLRLDQNAAVSAPSDI